MAVPLTKPYKSTRLRWQTGPVRETDPVDFRRSRTIVPVLEVLPEAGSTNDVLSSRAGDLPDLAVLVTENQTGGRGRLGRPERKPCREPGTGSRCP